MMMEAFKILKKYRHSNTVKCPKCLEEFSLNPNDGFIEGTMKCDNDKIIYVCPSCSFESSKQEVVDV